MKAALYSVAHGIDAEQYLYLDADMLILGDLHPSLLCWKRARQSVLAVCEGNDHWLANISHALCEIYGGSEVDKQQLFCQTTEATYPLVVNDGLFAGTRAALLALAVKFAACRMLGSG
jgi:hypothetical protein